MKITLEEYHHTCDDGCCDIYGYYLFVDGNKIGSFEEDDVIHLVELLNVWFNRLLKEAGMTKADMKEMLNEYLLHIRDYGALPNGIAGHRHFTFDDLHKGAEEFLAQFQDDSGC